jgi:hypothetical protein
LLGKQIALEALYSDFIGESARLLVDAREHNLLPLTGKILENMAERVGFEPRAAQQNKQIRRREWHTKPPQFSENKQLHILLDA